VGTGTVTALKSDERENIWVGTDARGAFVFNDGRKLDQFTFESTAGGLLSNHIYSIFIDREGVVWFGTDRGVCRYDPHALRVEAIAADAESDFARVLFQSSQGTLWCGTNAGLFARNQDSSWREVRELKGRVVHSIAEDPQAIACRRRHGPVAAVAIAPNSNRERPGLARRGATGMTDNIRHHDA
jgi:hypothetical protein